MSAFLFPLLTLQGGTWCLLDLRAPTESPGKIQLTTCLASLKKQKQQKTRTPLCKEYHHLCSHLRLVLFQKFGKTHVLQPSQAQWPSGQPGHLWLLLHKYFPWPKIRIVHTRCQIKKAPRTFQSELDYWQKLNKTTVTFLKIGPVFHSPKRIPVTCITYTSIFQYVYSY